ncbi:MAG: hypothetical protein AMXMBFR13_21410 [Phycisphaerae bacterium]
MLFTLNFMDAGPFIAGMGFIPPRRVGPGRRVIFLKGRTPDNQPADPDCLD